MSAIEPVKGILGPFHVDLKKVLWGGVPLANLKKADLLEALTACIRELRSCQEDHKRMTRLLDAFLTGTFAQTIKKIEEESAGRSGSEQVS
jgi:hypothetical protein